MRSLVAFVFLAVVSTFACAPPAMAADSDPLVGTWQLDVAKSTFTSGPALKSQTRTYSRSGPNITVVIRSTGADGKETTTQTTYQLDKKDYPVTGSADYDSISGQQSNARTATFTLKKAGKPVGTTLRTLSKDGQHMDSKTELTTAAGEKIENRLYFDRQ